MVRGERDVIRVVLVDDHPLVREGTQACLDKFAGIQVVATTGEGLAALRLVEEHRVDLLLLDIKLPDLNGVEVARRVRASAPGVKILVLTGHDEAAYFQAMVRIGVHGYLPKSTPCASLADAIRRVAMGAILMQTTSTRGDSPAGMQSISDREMMVLQRLALGRRNLEIAEELVLSAKTVEFHIGNLLSKLCARSRTEAIVKAREIGVLPADPRDMML